LDLLIEQVGKELDELDLDSEPYQAAPQELQDRLANYRKGVEIIHRMFSRIKDRRKELTQELPALATNGLEPAGPPAEVDQVNAYLRELSEKFHKLRDANNNTLREAEDVGEKCWKATVHVVKGVISAVDGIDSGLDNEPDTRAALKEYETEEQDFSELIDAWFQAYHRLQEHVEAFFGKTGIETHTVEPGTPFDPETMEPQSTVESSELNDEDVAAVARRGFSLQGAAIRPVMVDVVKNK
jgi:molecular chaperone GrpE (heat shock protein)